MSDSQDSLLASQEARDILESHLSQDDIERLQGIRHELSAHVKWGPLVDDTFFKVLEMLDGALWMGNPKHAKKCPFDQLFEAEQDYLAKDMVRRKNYVTFLLLRKLLGALKTRLNQEMDRIPVLTSAEEDDLLECIQENEDLDFDEGERAMAIALGNLHPRPRPTDSDADESPPCWPLSEADEEEMDLVTEELPDFAREGPRFYQPAPHPDELESGEHGETVIRTLLQREQGGTCAHTATTVTFTRSDGEHFRQEKCKRCDRILKREPFDLDSRVRVSKRKTKRDPDEPCTHPRVLWVEGKEGQEAYCAEKNCGQIVPNPEKYSWISAGLEPYGDDPAKDQFIVLDDLMSLAQGESK